MSLCPCMPLEKGVKTLAIIDAILSTLNLGMFVLSIVGLLVYDDDEFDGVTDTEKSIAIAVVIIAMILCVLQILLAARLFYGAKNRAYQQCRIWIVVTSIIVTINVASLILNSTSGEFSGVTLGVSVFIICYKIYEILVVQSFLQELGKQGTVFTTAAVPQPQPYYPAQSYYPGQQHVSVSVNSAFPQAQPQYQYPNNSQHDLYPMQQMGLPPQYNTNPVVTHQNKTTNVEW